MSDLMGSPLTFLDSIFMAPAEWDAEVGVVWLRGELDISTTPMLSEVISRALELGAGDLLLDLSEVLFMDASTVAVFARTRESLRRRSRLLVLRSPSRCANRVLDLCGFSEFTNWHPSGVLHPLEQVVVQRALAERRRAIPRAGRLVGRASLRLVLEDESVQGESAPQ
ncbi:MAG TPA: anti-sigma factor antagonist [Acidimicrobiales bacterium]